MPPSRTTPSALPHAYFEHAYFEHASFDSHLVSIERSRTEKCKERLEFETKQLHDERARAMIPREGGTGLMSKAASQRGGMVEDFGPRIVCYREDLVENADLIDEVEDFQGTWSLAALLGRRGNKCNKLQMLCARAAGKKASREYTALCNHRWA